MQCKQVIRQIICGSIEKQNIIQKKNIELKEFIPCKEISSKNFKPRKQIPI